jgi:hypothetical protein
MNREEAINEMLKYFKDNPEVGIFWYNEDEEELFEIHSMPAASLLPEQSTYPQLHKTIWQKLRAKARQKKKDNKPYDPIYLSDYTKIPRGRIFYKDAVFYVFTGSWITDKSRKQIKKEFKLQNVNVVFKTDIHWEIGHGWSTEEDVLNF